MNKNSNTKSFLSIIVLFIFIAWLGFYLEDNLDQFKNLRFVYPQYLIPIILLAILQYYIIGLATKYLLEPLGISLGRLEAFVVAVASGLYNLLTPFRAGLIARTMYFKRKYNLLYTDSVTIISANQLFLFQMSTFLSLASLTMIRIHDRIFNASLYFGFLFAFLMLSCILVFNPQIPESSNYFLRKTSRIISGWYEIRRKKKVVIIIMVLSILQLLNASIMLHLQFRVFDFYIPFHQAVFLAMVSYLSAHIAITPAGLGIKEALVVFSAATIQVPAFEALSVALLGRAVSLLVLLAIGPICSHQLLKGVRE